MRARVDWVAYRNYVLAGSKCCGHRVGPSSAYDWYCRLRHDSDTRIDDDYPDRSEPARDAMYGGQG